MQYTWSRRWCFRNWFVGFSEKHNRRLQRSTCRLFRNCSWLKRSLIFWFPDFRSVIHRFIAMNLRKSPQPVQQPKNCNCRKRKTECLGPWRELHACNQNLQWQLRLLWNPIVVGLASILKDRYRNHWTSSRPRNRQNELSKHIIMFPYFQ